MVYSCSWPAYLTDSNATVSVLLKVWGNHLNYVDACQEYFIRRAFQWWNCTVHFQGDIVKVRPDFLSNSQNSTVRTTVGRGT